MSACLAAAAAANDAPRGAPSVAAEVKKLDAEIRRSPAGEWLLAMEYKVKVKASKGATVPAEPLEMLIHMTDNGRTVVDSDGHAVVFVVPLETPKKSKADKREFEGETVISLGNDYAGDVEGLRLHPILAPVETASLPRGGVGGTTGGGAAVVGTSAANVQMQPEAGLAVRGHEHGGSGRKSSGEGGHSGGGGETRVYAAPGAASGLHPGSAYASSDDDDDNDESDREERGFEVEYDEPLRSLTFWVGPFGIGGGR